MKSIEFLTSINNHKIEIPENLLADSNIEHVRVIIQFNEDASEELLYKKTVQDQFLSGFSEEDSIYDRILVCRITSQKHFDKYDIIVENWAKFGLLIPSSIRVHKLATLDKKLFYKKLGSIDFEIEKQVKSLVSQLTDN